MKRVLTVTNFATGAHQEKPALWVDGNIHATELAPSSVCLYLLQTLVTAYGTHIELLVALSKPIIAVCLITLPKTLVYLWVHFHKIVFWKK